MTTKISELVKCGTNSAALVTQTPILDEGDVESKRQEILEYFHDTFTLYESIFECLADDDAFYARANPLRHPLIFYYGHTAVFFINKLNVANLIDQRIDPQIESTLAVGVDEMSWDDLNEQNYDWPTPARVKAYRDQTRSIVDTYIRECDFSLPIDWDSPMWIILMGIEHERIHLETTAVLIRELPQERVVPHPVWSNICKESAVPPENELIAVEGGQVEMGKSKSNSLYGWDLEYGYASETVESFHASKFLVSNQEFLQFVEAGGYQNSNFWTTEGWSWAEFRRAEHPVFWIKEGEDYKYRSMLEVIDMPWDWPAEINYLEAKAFCNWKSEVTGKLIRMPTEAEWYKIREIVDTDQPHWESAPGNINLEYEMSPCPVNRHQFDSGLFDVIGNVWQWTETPIDGYDGFEVHPTYDDFSAPTFDGNHNLFKGGCWISTGNYAIKDARYAFRRHFLQFSGLRYVEAEALPDLEVSVYETDQMVSNYIEFHYGNENLNLPNFPVTCIDEVATRLAGRSTKRALDIGCATARSSFELAKLFDHVDAVDLSVRLIEPPANLQRTGRQRYVCVEEGELTLFNEIQLEDYEGYKEVKDKIAFMQGDACNLVEKFNDYDLVFAGNLIDRLYDPVMFLESIKDRIRPGGLLVLVSPYTWSEEHTPRDKWLGGFKAATGESFTAIEGIEKVLGPEFKMFGNPVDVPFALRETRRKFQYGVSELTTWEKSV
ncbi:5-histidylcysteine sulfoxide synthase [bacterium]|nr:5-histidylcysteine sulfoxide synthase [bacterium]MDB4468627.1 5-histidylcysteine sulfoxide synthase [bacterium]MDB4480869.1 5-histidylcysteine sulfoxide synthase [bacterium]MDB4564419.1 5-histidylcysteine sulfoxide synthase [Mariniblastus sp.]